ncbi:hypothetical protein vB_SscM-2_005 [Staphylococcus phage vB_SscM-2]|nr:hypothetical protein vB_SscM-2_005 [Staphylococcus phage vB_SscM-2]
MTNQLTKKEIEQTKEYILNAIVEEINNQGTTFNFMKKVYNDYMKNEFEPINNIDFEDSIVYNVFDVAYEDLCYNYELIWELEQLGIFSTSDLMDDYI